MGRIPDPWRASDAWLPGRPVDGLEIHSALSESVVANLEDVSSKSWAIAAIDMCVVPTLTFDHLFAFLVLGHGRRQLLWFEVTRHPTAEWLARQITEAFPWRSAPTYLVRDNDRAYAHVFTSRVRAMGIRDRPISPQSPWQNGYAERLRRICGEFFALCGVLQSSAHALGITERCALASSRPNDLAPLSSFRSWPDYITNTFGYDFRKGQPSAKAKAQQRNFCQSSTLPFLGAT